ncbi:tetratricopeptide repeat protein [Winogradskyella sp.]|uniref:tetratricopeptide repeat protein n=1 Tax=Winogradskyella sp. TaxID=1883156 RepID=UPI003514A143
MKNIVTVFLITTFFAQSLMAQNSSPYQPDYRNQDYEKVIETAKKQLKINPKDSMANYFMAISYANLNEHKKAIENFKIAKTSGLNSPNVLLGLAKSYSAENNAEKALEELKVLDSLQVPFFRQLEDSVFDMLKDNDQFKSLKKNMYKRANPCEFDNNYRKFDFWVGEWDVYIQGQKIAESSITNTNGNCGILENWRPTNSNGGNSISYYDPADKKWKQNWVAGGSVSHYEEPENYSDGDIQLIAKGNNNWFRMIWTYNKIDDTVRQTQESSTDEGRTWTMGFDGLYKRKQED